MKNSRLITIGKKLDQAEKMMKIAKKGLSSANKKNPFWSKSDAMKRINEIKKFQRKLSNIWIYEQLV